MRLEHHLVGGYVRYISPYIIIIIIVHICPMSCVDVLLLTHVGWQLTNRESVITCVCVTTHKNFKICKYMYIPKNIYIKYN